MRLHSNCDCVRGAFVSLLVRGLSLSRMGSVHLLFYCCVFYLNLLSSRVKMDALASVGVNPDLPRDTLTTALLQSSSEDDLRDMRVKLFETAREKGLAHPKDILVKRLKRAVGPSLGTKYAIDIADLCYALRNEQLVSRTLLKNRKRSAAAFIAARSRVSSSPQTSDNALPSTASIDGTTRGSHDSVSHNCSENNENNRAITTLTRELGTLKREVTQML